MDKNVLIAICAAQNKNKDYISYDSALYLLGHTESEPKSIKIVSCSRKRSRKIGEYPIDFYFHKPGRPAKTIQITYQGYTLRVATLTQVFADLLTDYTPGIPASEIATWFWNLPYNPKDLMNLGHKTRPTTFRRALFLSVWAGKANFSEYQTYRTNSAPACLFPGEKTDLIWEKKLKIFFPSWLPGFVPAGRQHDCETYDRNWLVFRRHKSLITFMAKKRAILDSSEVDSYEFFSGFLDHEIKSNAEDFIKSFSPSNTTCIKPKWAKEHYSSSPEFRHTFRIELERALRCNSPRLISASCYAASELGCIDKAFSLLPGKLHTLFNACIFDGIIHLVKSAESVKIAVPYTFRIFVARAMAQINQFDTAIRQLEKASNSNKLSDDQLTDLYFAKGIVFRQTGKYNDAMTTLIKALKIATKKNQPYRTAAIKSAIASVEMLTGSLLQARKLYLEAYALCKEENDNSFQANIQTNLALLEFLTGNLHKSESFFNQVIHQQIQLNNPKGVLVAKISLAKIHIMKGNFCKALEILNTLKNCPDHLFKPIEPEEIALKAWAFELSGMSAKADHFWDILKRDAGTVESEGTNFLLKFIEIMLLAIRGHFSEALLITDNLLDACHESKLCSGDEKSYLFLYKALLMKQLNQANYKTFIEKAYDCCSLPEQHPAAIISRLLLVRLNPTGFDDEESELTKKLMNVDYYEPLWPLMADILQSRKTPKTGIITFFMKKARLACFSLLFEQQSLSWLKQYCEKIKTNDCRLLLSSDDCRQLTPDEVDELYISVSHQNEILVDRFTGLIKFRQNTTQINNNSLPGQLLLSILEAHPNPVRISTLFRIAWNETYDETVDKPAFKTTLYRARKLAGELTEDLKIEIIKNEHAVARTSASVNILG